MSRPELFERLDAAARVTVLSAPPGSGKSVLLRSWIAEAGLEGRAARVMTRRGERDPQTFWLSVLAALADTEPGSTLVRAVTASPDLDAWALVERLLGDLAPLEDRLWLVVDDVHELSSTEVLSQLELLMMRAPPAMCFVLATRHDVRLGLHRLRLEGDLAEIRAADLRFSLPEASQLFTSAGVDLSGPALSLLHQRTEGWAAGLRLAALSLAGHPDPDRFAREFSGSERTVAEYLLAEVLERQSEQRRRLLLRTSVLDQVNGELADLLTGDQGGERALQDLEDAGAFVVSLDPGRSWFRYHQLFADLLRLELRRAAPIEIAGLHRAAASWFADHEDPVEAIRHSQVAGDLDRAARLLADHWQSLRLDGQLATVRELLGGFPARQLTTDPQLAIPSADVEQTFGSLEASERYLKTAEEAAPLVPPDRQGWFQLQLGFETLVLAWQRGNLSALSEQKRLLQALADTSGTLPSGLGEDLRVSLFIILGSTQFWATGRDDEHRLKQAVALARQIGRPYLELVGLAHLAAASIYPSFPAGTELATQAIELAERHGWDDEPAVGVACTVLGIVATLQGRAEDAEPWIRRAERTLRVETFPGPGAILSDARGVLELIRHRYTEALAAFEAADRLTKGLASPHFSVPTVRADMVHALVRLGETERAREILAALGPPEQEQREIGIATAGLCLAEGDPHAALAALDPLFDGAVRSNPDPFNWSHWLARGFLLAAIARETIGDTDGADSALERTLDLAETNGDVTSFLLYPAPDLLERHARRRSTHAWLVAAIRDLLTGTSPPSPGRPRPPAEPLSDAELRVLRYLPTNLRVPEIAREIYLSPNTVKTHLRNLYAKLGTHRRTETVEVARELGLLAPRAAPSSSP